MIRMGFAEFPSAAHDGHDVKDNKAKQEAKMTRVRLGALLLIVVGLCAPLALAQYPEHLTTQPAELIDGAKTPDLIPDLTAWRLWLLSVTAQDSKRAELSEARRQAFLKAAGIPDIEISAAEEVIAQFRKDYGALVDDYNKRLNAGENPSISEFRAQRDALVQRVQNTLWGKLETTTIGKMMNHINREKTRMKVAREGR